MISFSYNILLLISNLLYLSFYIIPDTVVSIANSLYYRNKAFSPFRIGTNHIIVQVAPHDHIILAENIQAGITSIEFLVIWQGIRCRQTLSSE